MIMLRTRCHFVEDGPRPPVPGKEDINIFTSHLLWPENYEPMSKGSSDHACMRWVESLDTLLDDQEGITLFRSFLGREGSADVIDFWLACRGFWLAYCSPLSCSYTPSSTSFNKRRRKLAKAIYRKYISGGIVGKLIKTATKMFIHDRICRRQLDSTLFIQAKEEAQEMLKDAYQLFLKSDFLLTPSSFSDSIGQEVINSKQEEAGSSRHELKDHNQKAGNSNNELKSPTQTRMDDQQEVAECLPMLINRESETDLTTSNQEQLIEIDFTHTTTKKKADQSSYKQHRNMQRTHHVMKNIRVDPQTFAAELISRLELVRRKNQRQEEKTKAKDVPMFSHYDNVDGRLFGDRGHHSGDGALSESSNGEAEGYSWNRKCVFKRMTVAYFFCGETIPYQTSVKGDVVTLRHFKELLTKKGEYRFFFQKASEEFECGLVYEEVHEDDAILPVYESRIIGKVERMD